MRRQACVIGGWTEPRGSRPFFGALLLGVYDDSGRLQYIGHSGAGFTDAELGRVWKRLRALEDEDVAVRHDAEDERAAALGAAEARRRGEVHGVDRGQQAAPSDLPRAPRRHPAASVRREPDTVVRGPQDARGATPTPRDAQPAQPRPPRREHDRPRAVTKAAVAKLLDQIDAIEDQGGDGVLELPGGDRLEVSNLGKIFWPKLKLTKGDLFRHYVRVAPYILPVLADRPLVMKRYPNGVSGEAVLSASRARQDSGRRARRAGRDRHRDARRTSSADRCSRCCTPRSSPPSRRTRGSRA